MKRKINIFDKIGTLIPGYKGYQEREGRRECDRQLREKISDKLSEIENKINNQIENAELSELMEIEKNRKKINNLKDLIKYSPYGTSAFFSDSSIKESQLEHLYQMDLDVLDSVEKLESEVNADKAYELKDLIQKIEETINKRNQYLKDK
jgi:hypothetical protein